MGFPRLGLRREYKWSLEKYWRGDQNVAQLHEQMAQLRNANWQRQVEADMAYLVAGDFAYYDHVLELSEALGVVPDRHDHVQERLARCFAMARGSDGGKASEMKKWFNTNYHYIVPEFKRKQQFTCAAAGAAPPDVVEQCSEAKQFGKPIKAVMVGPLTYLYLGKLDGEGEFSLSNLALGDELATAYAGIVARLQAIGVEWLQLDEPVLSLELPQEWLEAMGPLYDRILNGKRPQVMLANFFGSAHDKIEAVSKIPVDGLHIDMVYGHQDLALADTYFSGRTLSVGAIDGRNIWRANLPALAETLQPLADRDGGLWIGSSCSLLHVPVDASGEAGLQKAGASVAFAQQKLDEIAALARTLGNEPGAADKKLFASAPDFPVHDLGWTDPEQDEPPLQPSSRQGNTGWPDTIFPTTTIGSLPQTAQIRAARKAWRKGEINDEQYEQKMREEIKHCVAEQEKLELDVLVHGECERNDMVEYFAYQLDGVLASTNGWVQSYGSRATRPPILRGDIVRPAPMTVKWSKYAASLTAKPMKGMLTGPVTIICWSFPRADVPRMRTAFQLADVLRDEVADLTAAGLPIIQIDEPALREGLPPTASERQSYLCQAVAAFNRIVADCKAQIHTHMCYGEFSDIAAAIAAMDADVISLETSRTDMSVLSALVEHEHSAGVGPGIYDVHSPLVPDVDAMVDLLERALKLIPKERLWINPDCGLKTRGWKESRESLRNLVAASRRLRELRG